MLKLKDKEIFTFFAHIIFTVHGYFLYYEPGMDGDHVSGCDSYHILHLYTVHL